MAGANGTVVTIGARKTPPSTPWPSFRPVRSRAPPRATGRSYRQTAERAVVQGTKSGRYKSTQERGPVMSRFQVIEYSSFFAVRDTQTGQERPMGDGVDVLFDGDGTTISVGTPGFCEQWAGALNA